MDFDDMYDCASRAFGCSLWLGEDVRGSGTRVIDSCEPPTWRMWINPGSTERVASVLNWCASFPASYCLL